MADVKIIFRLKEARTMKALSLRQAATQMGNMSHETLRKYEKGELPIDSKKLIAFAKFYDVTLDYLFPSPHRPKVEITGTIHICTIPKHY